MSSGHGEALVGAVDALAGLAVEDLCVAELQELTAALAPQLGRLAGVQSALLGELDARSGGQVPATPGPDGAPGPVISVRHWLRELTNMGGPAAGSALRTAIALRSLPLVSAAVRAGTIGPAQAAVLTRLVGPIDPAALADAEPALVTVAAGRDPQSLADYVRHLLATWCKPQFENDQRTQDAKRYLQTRREDDGMLTGRFRLTSGDSETILTLLEPLARSTGLTDGRDAGQRRADAMVEIFDLALRFADLPDAGGQRPQVSYVMPAGWAAGTAPSGTLTDLVEASLPTDNTDSGDPATASPRPVPVQDRCALGAWSGPQTRSRIETILCDARLSRVLLTPSARSAAWKHSVTPSPRPNAAPWPPATTAAPPAAARDHPPSATPTTFSPAKTVAPRTSATSSYSADATTCCGTKDISTYATYTSPGSPTPPAHTTRHERTGAGR